MDGTIARHDIRLPHLGSTWTIPVASLCLRPLQKGLERLRVVAFLLALVIVMMMMFFRRQDNNRAADGSATKQAVTRDNDMERRVLVHARSGQERREDVVRQVGLVRSVMTMGSAVGSAVGFAVGSAMGRRGRTGVPMRRPRVLMRRSRGAMGRRRTVVAMGRSRVSRAFGPTEKREFREQRAEPARVRRLRVRDLGRPGEQEVEWDVDVDLLLDCVACERGGVLGLVEDVVGVERDIRYEVISQDVFEHPA